MSDTIESDDLESLLVQIRSCKTCEGKIPFAPRPIIAATSEARILIVGQAPGTRVQNTGIPWNDPSGDKLREWMNIGKDRFYDSSLIAIMPMGLCYPGKGKSGDLPPRKECAPQWHDAVLEHMPNLELTLLIGQYAQKYYLDDASKTLTDTVKRWREFSPDYLPMPHPSPRNRIWLKKNPWFEEEVVPELRDRLKALL